MLKMERIKHLLLLNIFISFLLLSCDSKNTQTISPSYEKLTESVYSSVTIQPDSLYEVFSSVTGIIDKVMVQEGDVVKEGDKLFLITNNTPILNTENARLALQIAQENYNGKNAVLEDMKNEIEITKLKLINDSISYLRQKNLWQQKIGSKAEYDMSKLNFESSKNTYSTLKNKFNRTKNELKQQVEQAKNNYQASLILTKDFTITSNINGKVYAINKKPGEIVSSQQSIATLGSLSNFVVELLIDEVDIAKIETNQLVIVKLDAYSNKVFKAKVNKIYPQKNERTQTFKIDAEFIELPPKLYPGLSGEANIIINEKEKVLVIPKNYLVNNNSVKTKKGLVEITTGLESIDKIEVISGIDENTIIYQPEL